VSTTFDTLNLSPESLGAVKRARFHAPTPIQAQAIPPALAGRDVIGCAATGTGKTAAYLLPVMERLAGAAEGPVGLVLAPTRELAQQIAEQARFFGEPHGIRQTLVVGGAEAGAQVEALRQRPTLVIATPGRLADLVREHVVELGRVRMLVLDEADRMLEMGFAPELSQILDALPRERQTLLFSATLGHDVTRFAQETLRRPVRAEVTPSGTPAARAVQRLYEVEVEEKGPLLLTLLARDQLSTLVFTRTQERAERVQALLREAGYKAAVFHGERTRGQRRQALAGFQEGQYRCLVATDLAARGLDVEDVGHVINYDLPYSPADYVHRIGRTARAGATGRASSFVTPRDEEAVRAIEAVIRMPIPHAPVPREAPVFEEELARMYERRGEFERVTPEGQEGEQARPRLTRPTARAEGRVHAPARGRTEGRARGAAPRAGRTPERSGAPGRAARGKPGPGRARAGAAGPARGGGRGAGGRGGAVAPERGGGRRGAGGRSTAGPAQGGRGAGRAGGARRGGPAGGRSGQRRGGPRGGAGGAPRGRGGGGRRR
jgi:ATP-dependent RNA helicase RhlE